LERGENGSRPFTRLWRAAPTSGRLGRLPYILLLGEGEKKGYIAGNFMSMVLM
jgi:hypothetical protein